MARCTLAENQVAHFLEKRRRRIRQLSLQRVHALEIREGGQLPGRQLEERFHPAVDVGALGGGGRLLPRHQLGNVRLGHLSGRRQVPLLGAQLFEPMADDDWKVQDHSSVCFN